VASPFALAAPGGVLPTEQERVGYGDERWPVADTWAVPHRWVCSLDIVYAGDPKVRRGSGVLVGPRQVLTAAHNLYRSADGKAPESVHVIPARDGRTEPIGRFRAVAYSVSNLYLTDRVVGNETIRGPHPSSRFDYGLVTLERDIAGVVRDRARDPRPFGHWGHRQQGQSTHLRGLDGAFLQGKPLVVAGYPGDRCGRATLDKRAGCDTRDQATVQFQGTGMARVSVMEPGMLLHTADTHEGQSGSPVWMRFNDGSRYLVGIHVGAGPKDVRTGVYAHNRAVQLTPEVVALVRSWMPGVDGG
jgi:V8-like Glu-specific endopeptidase